MKNELKQISALLAATLCLASTVRAQDTTKTTTPATSSALKDEKERIGYSIGIRAGRYISQMKGQGFDLDLAMVLRAIDDIVNNKTPLMTDAEAQKAVNDVGQRLRADAEVKRKEQGEKNKVDGEKFLAENKNKEGVTTLPSGLQYKVLKAGSGSKPAPTDTVSTHYRGTLIDGTEFDSSYKNNKPTEFGVTGVIKGWTEALQLMPTGSKWQLFIPPDLAYGERGAGQKIGPNSALVFEIELLAIKPPISKDQPAVTSDIIKVPSAEGLKRGEKIETIKASDVERLQKEAEAAKKTPEKK